MNEMRDARELMSRCAMMAIVLLSVVGGPARGTELPDGLELMNHVYGQICERNVSAEGRLILFDAHGHSQAKSFRYRRRSNDVDTRELLRFTAPADIADVALLSVRARGSVHQYIFIPAIRRVRQIANTQRAARFVGSDFTFEDLDTCDWEAFSYHTIGEGERVDGRETFKLEAQPREPGTSQYARRLIWVAKDVPVILREQMFEADGSLVRERQNSQLHREGGIWGARQSEMRSAKENTRTLLSLDRVAFPASEPGDDFNPDALERGAGPVM